MILFNRYVLMGADYGSGVDGVVKGKRKQERPGAKTVRINGLSSMPLIFSLEEEIMAS